jgi:hypothetical protein
MAVLLLVGLVGVVVVLYAAERFMKARTAARRLQRMSVRLDAATRRADKQHEHQQAATQAREALTAFMPAINKPLLSVPGTAREVGSEPGVAKAAPARNDRERGGRAERGRGRRGPRTGEQRVRTGEHPVRSGEHPVRSGEHAVRPRPH